MAMAMVTLVNMMKVMMILAILAMAIIMMTTANSKHLHWQEHGSDR
jgi:competence protein ComGC